MFCIAAFIVLLVLGIVSAKYRKLLKKAWHCVWRKTTLRACDSTFKDELKATLLAPVAVTHPKLVKPLSIAIEVGAWILVITTIVSLYIVLRAGLNLYVYGTCDTQNASSCSLGAKACSINSVKPSFGQSLMAGNVIGAFTNEAETIGQTISEVPNRMKHWEAKDYLPEYPSYKDTYDKTKPLVVEIIDPGCIVCKETYNNIVNSGFDKTHNIAYIPYAIKIGNTYKFSNSGLTASYLTALRIEGTHTDWFILSKLYGNEKRTDGLDWQTYMNSAPHETAKQQLITWMREDGMSTQDINQTNKLASSPQVAKIVDNGRYIVDHKVHTLKIPSLIFDGRLHSGLVSQKQFEQAK